MLPRHLLIDIQKTNKPVLINFYMENGSVRRLFAKTNLTSRDIMQSGLQNPEDIEWGDEGEGATDFLSYLKSISRAKPNVSIRFTSIGVSIYDALVPACKQFDPETNSGVQYMQEDCC